ncbi:MAG: DUF5668 domain-containing protein [Caldilineaceae bacterium]
MRDEQRSRFVGPFILVAIGLLFLFNNLGLINVNFWRLASTLWPIVLIGIGLDKLIGGRSTTGSLLAVLVTALLLVGGALFVGIGPATGPSGEVTEIRYAPGPVEGADVRISTSTGRLVLGSLAEAGVVMEGSVHLAGNETLTEDQRVEKGRAIYRLGSEGVGVVGVSGNESLWELAINGEIPTNLEVNTGAGEAELNLQRVRLTRLKVDLGVGSASITLPRTGQFNGEISGGIGKLVVRVPDSLAVRLQVDTGIGQVQVDDDFTTAGKDVYLSPAADAKGEGATVKISSGIGQVVIESIAGE